jgi:hypothetical protein
LVDDGSDMTKCKKTSENAGCPVRYDLTQAELDELMGQ